MLSGEVCFEVLAEVVLVADQGLPRVLFHDVTPGVQHAQQRLALIGLGAGDREQDRQPLRTGCTPGAAAAPRRTGNATRSSRTRPSPGDVPLRLTVSRDRPHSTGVESTTQTSLLHSAVSIASIRITRMNSQNAFRTRLLYPDCPIRRGNMPARFLLTWRSQRRSEVNPSRADITAIVSSSASLTVGGMLPSGRAGARSGHFFSMSSIFTYSAIARVSMSFSTTRSWRSSLHHAGHPLESLV